MTDLLDASVEPTGTLVKICAIEGCDNEFSSRQPNRKYCDDHQVYKPAKGQKKDKKPRGIPNVNIDLRPARGNTKDKELALVQERVEQLLGFVQVLLVSAGQVDDATDVGNGKAAVAEAARELAKYEDWLRKLAQGGETTGRALAWLTMIGALVGMLVPILSRHKVIPAEWAQMAAGATVVVPMPVTESVRADDPAPEPTSTVVA